MLLVLLSACQEPFPEDRHDLTNFRIVAMTGTRDAPSATLWSGAGLWFQPLPTLAWSWDDDAVRLETTDAEGNVESGALTVDVGAQVPALAGFTRTEDADGVWTIDLDLDRGDTHFMAPAGTFAESGPNTTTWDPEGATGIVPVVCLSFDGLGGNRVDVIDIPVGVAPPWLEVGGRIFPYDGGLVGAQSVVATLASADDYHGVALTDVGAGSDAEPFDLESLGRAEVARDDVVGLQVQLDATAVAP